MDKSKSPKQGQQIIKLSFVGLDADKGVIGVRDLTMAPTAGKTTGTTTQ